MSTHQPQSPEETADEVHPEAKPQGRGFFFYVAVFFILIATLCYLINISGVNWTPTAPAPAASSAPAPK